MSSTHPLLALAVRQPPFTSIWTNRLTKLCGRDLCAAFDEGKRSLGLLPAAPFDFTTLDRRLIALIQSICRRCLGQRRSSAGANGSRKHVLAREQDPQVSTLLYKSAAAESWDNGDISTSERGHSEGLSALQEIAGSLADRWTAQKFCSWGHEFRKVLSLGTELESSSKRA